VDAIRCLKNNIPVVEAYSVTWSLWLIKSKFKLPYSCRLQLSRLTDSLPVFFSDVEEGKQSSFFFQPTDQLQSSDTSE
jgi:hypothetical protein